jgi:hypothetical protein
MYQAIKTKFFGPTNYRGARVKAYWEGGSITREWDYSLGVEGNHTAAAQALIEKLGWVGEGYGDWIGGSLPNSSAYAFVCVGR